MLNNLEPLFRFDRSNPKRLHAFDHIEHGEMWLDVTTTEAGVQLRYADNGKGYEPPGNGKKQGGMGLANIIRRAGLIDASVEFINREGKTTVQLKKYL